MPQPAPAPLDIDIDIDLDAASAPACAACPHERDAHDAHGTRFCAATAAASLPRGCICVGEARRSVAR